MRLTWPVSIKNEDGYTLVETLVAMALFFSVLIPLGVAIGTFLLDKEAEEMNQALLLAEREMTQALTIKTFENAEFDAGGGFTVRRSIAQLSAAREIRISVALSTKPGKILLTLSKTVLKVP